MCKLLDFARLIKVKEILGFSETETSGDKKDKAKESSAQEPPPNKVKYYLMTFKNLQMWYFLAWSLIQYQDSFGNNILEGLRLRMLVVLGKNPFSLCCKN